jgi:hypothetical protein
LGIRLQESKSTYTCQPLAEMDALVHIGDHGAGIQRGEYLPPGAVMPLVHHFWSGRAWACIRALAHW